MVERIEGLPHGRNGEIVLSRHQRRKVMLHPETVGTRKTGVINIRIAALVLVEDPLAEGTPSAPPAGRITKIPGGDNPHLNVGIFKTNIFLLHRKRRK